MLVGTTAAKAGFFAPVNPRTTHGAKFFADLFGRWPTLVAARCKVDDDLSDYIAEAEARYIAALPDESGFDGIVAEPA